MTGDRLVGHDLTPSMAGSGGNPGPSVGELATEESGDQGPVPNKRMKIEAAAAELVGWKKRGIDSP